MKRLAAATAAFLLVPGLLAACGDDEDEGGADIEAACEAWSEWMSDGEDAHLDDLMDALGDDEGAEEIQEAIDALDAPTDTPDQQAAHEGAVDFINSEMQVRGCEE